MQIEGKPQEREYTYKDYLTWPEDEHWEIIDGKAYPTYGPTALATPTTVHQRLAGELFSLLKNHLRGKQCEVFASPIDVVFEASEDTKTVVQPDILVVCDPDTIRERNIVGAPDMVLEVLSPTTSRKDWGEKWRLYEEAGVKEYWIVNPSERAIHKNTLTEGQYRMEVLEEGKLTSMVLEDFSLDIGELFSILGVNNQGTDATGQEAIELQVRQEEKLKIAKNAIREGASIGFTQKITGLSLSVIKQLQSEIQ